MMIMVLMLVIRIYENIGGTWSIHVYIVVNQLVSSVSLSGYGNTVAIGAL